MKIEFRIRRVPNRRRQLETVKMEGEIVGQPMPRIDETLVLKAEGRQIWSTVAEVVYFYENGNSRAVIFSDYVEMRN